MAVCQSSQRARRKIRSVEWLRLAPERDKRKPEPARIFGRESRHRTNAVAWLIVPEVPGAEGRHQRPSEPLGDGDVLMVTPIETGTAAGRCFLDMLACSPSEA